MFAMRSLWEEHSPTYWKKHRAVKTPFLSEMKKQNQKQEGFQVSSSPIVCLMRQRFVHYPKGGRKAHAWYAHLKPKSTTIRCLLGRASARPNPEWHLPYTARPTETGGKLQPRWVPLSILPLNWIVARLNSSTQPASEIFWQNLIRHPHPKSLSISLQIHLDVDCTKVKKDRRADTRVVHKSWTMCLASWGLEG